MLLKVNDIMAFIIELVSIICWAKWAYLMPKMQVMKIIFSVLVVVIFAITWGMFFAPNAKYSLTGQIRWFLEFLILFLPFIQFVNNRVWFTVIAALIIMVNLYIQAKYGRSDW